MTGVIREWHSEVWQVAVAALSIGALAAMAPLEVAAQTPPQEVTVIQNVRLFDGERVHDRTTVVIRDGHVAEIGPRARVPAGARVISGAGMTLLPGLIDAHTHTFGREHLATALGYGVVIHLDMFGAPAGARSLIAEQRAGRATDRADLHSAMVLVTVTGGHGTQFGFPIPTLDSPGDAREFVRARIAEGSEWIKIVREDGSAHGSRMNSLDSTAMHAVIDAAHAEGKLAVVHVTTLRTARQAVYAGADGLVHLWIDSVADVAFAQEMARRRVFVVPTLTILQSATGTAGGAGMLADSTFAALLGPDARESLERSFPANPSSGSTYDAARESLQRLVSAGVRVLAGSDAPNPGTWFGASVHRELELLVDAGMSPIEALRGATARTADAFRLEGRGRVMRGARADLLLVSGDPTSEITDSRRIVHVWKAGRPVDRQQLVADAASRVAAQRAGPAVPSGLRPGMVLSDFESGTLASAFGAGWVETTDAMIGGRSSVTLRAVEGGANASGHALEVAGESVAGAPVIWSGAMFFPASPPMTPADLSATEGFAFQARGSPGTYRIFFFSRTGGQMPRLHSFLVTPEWREVRVRWSDFGSDGADVTGIAIVGPVEPGSFRLLIDDVVFR